MVCASAACGVLSPEEQLLTDFFEASRLNDTTAMAKLSGMPLNPRTDGIVDAFDIERIEDADNGAERVTVLARVRTFDGQVSSRRLEFVLGKPHGRWFISGWTWRS